MIDQVEPTRDNCVVSCWGGELGLCLNARRRKDLCGHIARAMVQ